jgi:hypothetical protein
VSHFAKVENGIVTQVIVAEQDFINTGLVGEPNTWIQTSYNTRANVHYDPITNQPDNGIALRGNYAGIGYTYDSANDVFYTAAPYPSWHISSNTWSWQPPVECPNDGNTYDWDEANTQWVLITTP